MFPCLCVLHTHCCHDSRWMLTLHVSSSKQHWLTQGCQCRTPMLHIDATHSNSLASNIYHKLKTVLFVLSNIVTIQHALLLSQSPTQKLTYEQFTYSSYKTHILLQYAVKENLLQAIKLFLCALGNIGQFFLQISFLNYSHNLKDIILPQN